MKKASLLAFAIFGLGVFRGYAESETPIVFRADVPTAVSAFRPESDELVGVRLPAIPKMVSRGDPDRTLLWAIREVETGNNPRAIGRLGERGAYQFRRHTWQQIAEGRPFHLAHTAEADTVARRFLRRLEDGLASAGLAPTAYNLALAWNAGLGRVVSGNIPRASIDYAARVSRLARNASGS
jgi:soluble lytic murein transglycosylase-like protein